MLLRRIPLTSMFLPKIENNIITAFFYQNFRKNRYLSFKLIVFFLENFFFAKIVQVIILCQICKVKEEENKIGCPLKATQKS